MTKIALLGGDLSSTWIVAREAQKIAPVSIIIEDPQSKFRMVRNRMKKLGLVSVVGQILFQFYYLARTKGYEPRRQEIIAGHGYDDAPFPSGEYLKVDSVNDDQTIEALKALQPDVVLVNGTRIISSKVLQSIDAPFINTHTGITPAYRGVHGGYWALYNDDPGNFGSTVHLVDKGVDTGDVLFQKRFKPGTTDNYFTYLTLQSCEAVPLILQAVSDALGGTLKPTKVEGESLQWYHPTLWGYFWCGIKKGIW